MNTDYQLELNGKILFLTGASGLLGSEYVAALLNLGAIVIATDLHADSLVKLNGPEDRLIKLECDVNSEKSVKAAISEVADRYGRLDGLVNNAAATGEHLMRSGAPFGKFEEYSLEMWEQVIRTNLTGPFLVCREASRLLESSGKASIVNVSSTYGVVGPDHRIYEGMPFNSMVSYAASKAGVHGLTRWLATYLGPRGVRVNTVVPGGVENGHSPLFVERYANRTPLGRMGRVSDLGGMICFLMSDLSSYSTGQMFFVDGGWTAI